MSDTIDARGLTCPQPVILAKRRIDQGEESIVVMVDNAAAKENVSRLGENQGYEVTIEEQGEDYQLIMYKKNQIEHAPRLEGGVAILVSGDLFGQGDEELGRLLMENFLYALNETAGIEHIIFMNQAVFLTTEGSPVLSYLETLQEKGIAILSCGICLDYYQRTEQLAVGTITNMYSAIEILSQSAKTLTI